ncbi:MAG: hypothetical protein ABI769_14000 [Pseudomonadota bacterium]
MAKTNYNQAKRQKENARKARQQEKLAKKLARVSGDPEAPESTEAGGVPAVDVGPVSTETKEAQ